jgi:hypothetical protein
MAFYSQKTAPKSRGNAGASGRKKSNFSTSCLTSRARRSYLRNKIERIFPRSALTFHHNAAGSFATLLLLEDGRFVLQGDAALGRRLWEDPVVLERVFQLFPTSSTIENRRLESAEQRADYDLVKQAMVKSLSLPVSELEVKSFAVAGSTKASESYLTGSFALPAAQLLKNQEAGTKTPASDGEPKADEATRRHLVLVASICDTWILARQQRRTPPRVEPLECLVAWRPQ